MTTFDAASRAAAKERLERVLYWVESSYTISNRNTINELHNIATLAIAEIERLEAENAELRRQLDIAIDFLQDRDRVAWNPSGYWIDGVLRGKDLASAIAILAAKGASE